MKILLACSAHIGVDLIPYVFAVFYIVVKHLCKHNIGINLRHIFRICAVILVQRRTSHKTALSLTFQQIFSFFVHIGNALVCFCNINLIVYISVGTNREKVLLSLLIIADKVAFVTLY